LTLNLPGSPANVGPPVYGPNDYPPAIPVVDPSADDMPVDAADASQESTPIASLSLAEYDARFVERGEDDFRQGDFHGARFYWRHALLDDPQNPVLLMMLGQAFFATGAYHDAAGATQAAMHSLPAEQWGVVVVHFRELYGNPADYTLQLRDLEQAVARKPEDPARHFLLGFHYGFLGYPQHAVAQLDKCLKIEPRDEMARRLRDEMQAKLPKATAPSTPATERANPG